MVVHVCTSSRSRDTLVQTKSGEHRDAAGEHWDGSQRGRSRPRNGDSVSYFIVLLVYLLLLEQPFRFRRLERTRTPPRQQQAQAGSMVCRKQHFCPVFSAPYVTTLEATTLSQTAQRCEARTTSTSTSRSARNSETFAAALNPIDRCYSARKKS